ncbi:hypothetical protein GCM10018787_49880 [Streptomyces thermodiastaticus]|nr:hypothetical protein GCM10018787_49880 [Streptomyces thermodiastaticus]
MHARKVAGPRGTDQNDQMEYTLEVVILPVTHVDRSLAYYTECVRVSTWTWITGPVPISVSYS